MEFIEKHWGDLFSVAGFIFALIGLAYAGFQSKKARSSAEAAENAANETRDSIGRHLLIIDLERAINIIERLKLLHRNESWEAALENYQTLRAMLFAIIARYPENEPELRERLSKATESLSTMELEADSWVVYRLQTIDVVKLNQELNDIQSSLEEMTSDMGLGV